MIFVPLLHYFKCKNSYSGNEYGLRYRMIPGKRTVPDPDGGEGAAKEESILTVDYWPDPWTIEKTDPAGAEGVSAVRRGPRGCRRLFAGRFQCRAGALEELSQHDGL